ncbi:putative late blight resistance protein-like protein R1B-14 [Forsythia ovata]|uniref:Late blight resistance protein-like protein R1B-14 n=1 Tax=Forsythia ovata TaxID=205694 RepID=A0ABD1TV81_9LAMI
MGIFRPVLTFSSSPNVKTGHIYRRSNTHNLKNFLYKPQTAYEIEYIINSFPHVWYLTLRLPQFMDKIKRIMMGIKETKKNIDTGIVEVENHPIEQVLSQEKCPLILEDIVVGFDKKETKIVEQLVRGPEHLQIISIFGMPGVGKTTLAKKLYNNPTSVHHFDKRAWCIFFSNIE